jgi:Mn-dependent DtxR family transcriptional regulator
MMKTWKYLPKFEGVTAISKLIWLYIAQHGQDAYGTLELAQRLDISNASVSNALNQLEEKNLIEVIERGSGKNARVVRAIMD